VGVGRGATLGSKPDSHARTAGNCRVAGLGQRRDLEAPCGWWTSAKSCSAKRGSASTATQRHRLFQCVEVATDERLRGVADAVVARCDAKPELLLAESSPQPPAYLNALLAAALFNSLTCMVRTSSNARSLFAFAAFSLLGCGGAEVGEGCDDSGSLDDCEDGAICTNEDQGAVCRLLCKDTAECPPAHSCNGVSGSSLKSCQPDKP
jgi:hypothetical protein